MSGFKRLKQGGLLGRFVVSVFLIWLGGLMVGVALMLLLAYFWPA